jgi:adenylate cyclase
MGDFFAELNRRKVIRVAVVYCVVGFAVIEAADIMAGAFNIDNDLVAIVAAITLLGFPISLVLAWSYDLVPDAVAKERIPESSSRTPRRTIVLLGILVLILVVWYQYQSTLAVETASASNSYSVAVMPLRNLTDDPSYDNVGASISDEAIQHLYRIPQLLSRDFQSAQAIMSQNLTVPQIATELSVSHVVIGTIRLDEADILVGVQLLDGETGTTIDERPLRAPLEERDSLYSAVATQVIDMIVSRLPGMPQFNRYVRVNIGEGQDAYLNGKRWLSQRTPAGIRIAISSLEAAISLDPDFAPAFAELSSAYALALFYRYEVGADEYTIAGRSLALAERALELDSNLAIGYAARGFLGALIGLPANDVAADFAQAAALKPNLPSVPSWMARSLMQQNRTDDAVEQAEKAIEIEPTNPGRYIAYAGLLFQIERYEDAIRAARSATELQNDQYFSRVLEGRALLLRGRPGECADLDLGPYRVLTATCLYAAGKTVDAEMIVDEMTSTGITGEQSLRPQGEFTEVITLEDLAIYYARRADADNALFWAERAYNMSPIGIDVRVLESELFGPVRGNSEFDERMAEVRATATALVRRVSTQFVFD